jgi:hypothetical protein
MARQLCSIDGYPLDLCETEVHTFTSEITDHQVEDGSDIADNIRNKSIELTLTNCVVSDHPIGTIATDGTRLATGDDLPSISQDAANRMLAIRDAKQPVVVVTGWKRYPSMGLEEFTVTRDAKSFGGLVFTAKLKEIRVVKNKRVKVAVVNLGPRNNLGARGAQKLASNQILWRKGKPPGTSPATDPKGVIYAEEIVETRDLQTRQTVGSIGVFDSTPITYTATRSTVVHSKTGLPLTTEELFAFSKDMNRDSALATNRELARQGKQLADQAEATKRWHALQDYKEEYPGTKADPAMFGLVQDPKTGNYGLLPTPPGAATPEKK